MGNLVKIPNSELNSTLEVLEFHGVDQELFARIRQERNTYGKRVADFMRRGAIELPGDHRLARAIMGPKNYIGIEDWAAWGVTFTPKQFKQVATFPWSEDVLLSPCPFYKNKLIRKTHVARLGLDKVNGELLTILKWQALSPATLSDGKPNPAHFASYAPRPWYVTQKFAIEITGQFRWYLDLLGIVPKSTSTSWNDQKAMLPAEYEVPLAVSEVAKHLQYYKKNGVWLNKDRYGRCEDVTSGGGRVDVGDSPACGLRVDYWNEGPDGCIGVAASRKLNLETSKL